MSNITVVSCINKQIGTVLLPVGEASTSLDEALLDGASGQIHSRQKDHHDR